MWQFTAKHRNVKHATSAEKTVRTEAHVPEKRARHLLWAIKAELERTHGRTISYEELGRQAGQAASTVFKRLQGTRHPPIEALLSWLERLPVDFRHSLIDHSCRCFPHLSHESISYDAAQTSTLRAVAQQSRGLSVICSDNRGLQTFVISALGHEIEMLRGMDAVRGFDLNRPDWFVPLIRVEYLADLSNSAQETAVRRIMADLMRQKDKFILVNASPSLCRPFQPALYRLASKCHVALTCAPNLGEMLSTQVTNCAVNLITVSLAASERIHVTIQQS